MGNAETMEKVDEGMKDRDPEKLLEKLMDKFPYQVKLKKPYNWNGKEISEIDLIGLDTMTTRDMEVIDREMREIRYKVDPDTKFTDTVYVKHLVSRITGLPTDFFDLMRVKDMQEIISVVRLYFLI